MADVLVLTVYYHMDSFTGTTIEANGPVGVFSSPGGLNQDLINPTTN